VELLGFSFVPLFPSYSWCCRSQRFVTESVLCSPHFCVIVFAFVCVYVGAQTLFASILVSTMERPAPCDVLNAMDDYSCLDFHLIL
jgi:fucose permease